VVRRKKATAPQAGLTSAQRRKNVQGAFDLKRGPRLDGLSILLIDDVLTTGATASACARALKRAGAARVSLLTLARRDRRAGTEFQRTAPGAGLGSSESPQFSAAAGCVVRGNEKTNSLASAAGGS